MPWDIVIAVVVGLGVVWVVLVAALWIAKPDEMQLRDALRILPDLVGLLRRVAADRSLPQGVRVRVWLLIAYLAMPIDLVPDVIPVMGYADDAVVVMLVLRSVVRRAGAEALERHWRGSADGLAVVRRLAGVR
ncbi:YkvA family protein [Aeromicrobium sp. Root495]|uniref:YkvA family protein n=1 Tax=Aeromicrobium sp. Root495 TaxID=1736550 RepID=UPI000A585BAC|nr:YkvA family protein [Aeromicrobium sp. Root495]